MFGAPAVKTDEAVVISLTQQFVYLVRPGYQNTVLVVVVWRYGDDIAGVRFELTGNIPQIIL